MIQMIPPKFGTKTWHHPKMKPNKIRDFILEFNKFLLILHPNINKIKWAFIVSGDNSTQQSPHCDNTYLASFRLDHIRTELDCIPFSIIFDIENDVNNVSKLCVHDFLEKKVPRVNKIAPGGCIVFRGDCLHSGVAYTRPNIRLFLGVGTHAFPWDDNSVEIVVNDSVKC